MGISNNTRFKANILKAVIDQVTGGQCVLQDRENSIKIILTESQKQWIRNFINTQLDLKKKPDIEVDVLGILLPVILKRGWPFFAAAGGGLAALIFGRKRCDDEETDG